MIILKNESVTATINEVGAELTSVVSKSGYEYIWQGSAWPKHSPILFPVCGMLKDGKYTSHGKEYMLEKHGFIKKCEFLVEDASDVSATLSYSSDDYTRQSYPFDFKLTVKYELKENLLSVAITVENTGKRVMPYMLGWHPAFALGGKREIGSFYVTFPEKKSLLIHHLQNGPFVNPLCSIYPIKGGKYYLNEKEIYENDTLIFSDVPGSVRLAGGGLSHSVTLSYSPNLKYLCLWKFPSESARFVCLEPWSDIPKDGETPENFDSRDMARLSVGEEEEYLYTVLFE